MRGVHGCVRWITDTRVSHAGLLPSTSSSPQTTTTSAFFLFPSLHTNGLMHRRAASRAAKFIRVCRTSAMSEPTETTNFNFQTFVVPHTVHLPLHSRSKDVMCLRGRLTSTRVAPTAVPYLATTLRNAHSTRRPRRSIDSGAQPRKVRRPRCAMFTKQKQQQPTHILFPTLPKRVYHHR